jgi:hypothetical protein
MTMMTKNPIAFAKQMDDFMTSVNGRLDAIMDHLGIPVPGAEPAPDQPPPPEPAPAIVQGRPPAEVIPEPAPADPEPRAAKKKG